jgi:amino acid transporter
VQDGARAVEEKSASLRKELRLSDLVLAQIVLIVGSTWVGVAGKLGAQNLAFWLLATALFFAPLAAVVVFLNRCWPLEGGLYQWAKLGLGGMGGFLVAWNLWVWAIVNMSSLGLEIATFVSYSLGAKSAWMATSRAFILATSVGVVGGIAVACVLGLGVGKWVHNAGAAMRLGTYAVLLLLPAANMIWGDPVAAPVHWEPTHAEAPSVTLFSLNVLGKMGFGAFSGFEYVAIFAGEARAPARSIRASVFLATPIVVGMFVFGTSSVLAFSRPDDIDLIGPIPQAISLGTRALGPVRWLVPLSIAGVTAGSIAWGSAAFTGITRLPMVAGWDGLVPRVFTTLHPRWRTPVWSVVLVAAVTLAVGVLGLVGVGEQEAYQLFGSAALIFYALTYLVMFALPIVRARSLPVRPSLALRLGCASGFAMTLLFIVLSLLPIVHVKSTAAFTAKVGGVVVAMNALGLATWVLARRRRARDNVPP